MWSDFNTANRNAMMRSEFLSWPVTLAILVLAFGALVAAGLPLLLTIIGLAASAGALYLTSQVTEVSIWAMNFALMFALALGIDYALFIVVRFRGAFFGRNLSADGRRRRDHGHRRQSGPVLRADGADLAVGGHARPEPGVPLDGARNHALGDLHPAGHADAAARRRWPSWGRASTRARCPGRTAASTARRALPPGASACGADRRSTACPR